MVANVKPKPHEKISVGACNMTFQLSYLNKLWNARGFEIQEEENTAKIRIAFTRFNCKNMPGEIIYIVEREGVPLTYVKRGN